MTVKSLERPSTSDYVRWEPGSGLVRVSVSTDTVSDMQPLLSGNPDGRLPETGGVLFGRTEQTNEGYSVWVDGFAPFEIEHVRGASWTLSVRDRRMFARAVQKWRPRGVVGWFRTHTRPGLFLDQHDFSLFVDFFPHPSAVALVIRAGSGVAPEAGFFVWEDGDMRRTSPHATFSFRPQAAEPAIVTESPQLVRHATQALVRHATHAKVVSLPSRKREPERKQVTASASWRRKALMLAPIAAGLMAGIFWNPDITPRQRNGNSVGARTRSPEGTAERTLFEPAHQADARGSSASIVLVAPAVEAHPPSSIAEAAEVVTAPVAPRKVARQVRSRQAEPPKRRVLTPVARKASLPSPQVLLATPELKFEDAPARLAAVSAVPAPTPELPEMAAPAEQKRPSALRRAVGSIPGLGFLKKKKKADDD